LDIYKRKIIMKENIPIEIFTIYRSNEGRETSFYNIVNSKDVIDDEHYEPSKFWNCMGGLSVCINQYQTVFCSTNFYNLVKATSFLIHSLYWIKNRRSDWFDIDDDYPNDIILRTTSNEIIRLANHNEEALSLSFTSSEVNHVRQRGDRYFESVLIKKEGWYAAAKLALEEYFEVLLRVVKNSSGDSTSRTMMSYYDVWKNLKAIEV